jgi:hypothetical protein
MSIIKETKTAPTPFKVGDRVFSVDRPSYALRVVCVVNDELIKAVTIGWKGAEFFAICELVLIESAIATEPEDSRKKLFFPLVLRHS